MTQNKTALAAATALLGLALGISTAHAGTTSTQLKTSTTTANQLKTTASNKAEGANDATTNVGAEGSDDNHALTANQLKTTASNKSEGANDLHTSTQMKATTSNQMKTTASDQYKTTANGGG